MKNLQELKQLIDNGDSDDAILATERWMESKDVAVDDLAQVYYLRGNAYRKQENWGKAMTCYLRAIDLNGHESARQAYAMAKQVMNFYNKDYYNP